MKTPTTPSLSQEPIRAELPAQHYIQQLPSIQNLLLYLERKGTSDKERAKQLLREDFQYQLTTPDGTMIFRKPK